MQLQFSDLFAVGAFMLGAVGINHLIASSQIAGAKAEIVSEVRVLEDRASTDRNQIKNQITGVENQIEVASKNLAGIVEKGLSSRSNEVALAISELSVISQDLVLTIANMPTDGDAYRKFDALAGSWGHKATVFKFMGMATGKIVIEDWGSEEANLVASIAEGLSEEEMKQIDVKMSFEPVQLDLSNELSKKML